MVASVAKRFISPIAINIRVIPEISSSALTGTLFGPFYKQNISYVIIILIRRRMIKIIISIELIYHFNR